MPSGSRPVNRSGISPVTTVLPEKGLARVGQSRCTELVGISAFATSDVADQVGVPRAHIFQRLLPVQMLWAGHKIESLVSVGVVGVAGIIRIRIIDDGVSYVDIHASQGIDHTGKAA